MTPEQCRAARGLLDLSQRELGRMANVSDITVRLFEGRKRVPIANNLSAMRRALEDAGAEFIGGEKEGVRFAKSVHVRGEE
jgi:transcriptional regulator with XRE-family HTH domain